MGEPAEDELVKLVARDLVTEIAPHERAVFPAYSEAYFKSPEKVLKANTGDDDMLGFGVEVVIPLLTPVILAVTTEVVHYLEQALGKAIGEGGVKAGATVLKGTFKRFGPGEAKGKSAAPSAPPSAAPLSAEQIKEIRALAFEKARQLRVPAAQANLLADSMVGSLRLAPAT